MASASHGAEEKCFEIERESIASRFLIALKILTFKIDIQTETFSIPKDYLTPNKNRRFFVSASDGRNTHSTSRVTLHGQSLQWSETLAGL